jgi:hypothetical protein
MLQVLSRCYVLQWLFLVFSCVFASISNKHVANISSVCFKSRSGVAAGYPAAEVPPSGHRRPDGGSGRGTSRGSGGAGPAWMCKTECRREHQDVHGR